MLAWFWNDFFWVVYGSGMINMTSMVLKFFHGGGLYIE